MFSTPAHAAGTKSSGGFVKLAAASCLLTLSLVCARGCGTSPPSTVSEHTDRTEIIFDSSTRLPILEEFQKKLEEEATKKRERITQLEEYKEHISGNLEPPIWRFATEPIGSHIFFNEPDLEMVYRQFAVIGLGVPLFFWCAPTIYRVTRARLASMIFLLKRGKEKTARVLREHMVDRFREILGTDAGTHSIFLKNMPPDFRKNNAKTVLRITTTPEGFSIATYEENQCLGSYQIEPAGLQLWNSKGEMFDASLHDYVNVYYLLGKLSSAQRRPVPSKSPAEPDSPFDLDNDDIETILK
jgi:hypothetical protein